MKLTVFHGRYISYVRTPCGDRLPQQFFRKFFGLSVGEVRSLPSGAVIESRRERLDMCSVHRGQKSCPSMPNGPCMPGEQPSITPRLPEVDDATLEEYACRCSTLAQIAQMVGVAPSRLRAYYDQRGLCLQLLREYAGHRR